MEIPEPYYTVHTDTEVRGNKTKRHRARITCLFDGKLHEIYTTHWYNENYLCNCFENPIQHNIGQAFDFIRSMPNTLFKQEETK